MIVASVTFSSWMRTPSFASTAWWRPSLQRRPSMMRPVNSSTIFTSPSCDDVVDVALVQRLRLQRLVEVVDELHVARVVEVLDVERTLDRLDRRSARRDRLVLLVEHVVGSALDPSASFVGFDCGHELLHDAREVVVDLGGGLGLAGDDQRRARLVDQDRVDLVHDRERVAALHDALERDGHVVAQVVEAELGVRAVGDVGGVGLLALRERHHVLDVRDAERRAARRPGASTRRRAWRGSR